MRQHHQHHHNPDHDGPFSGGPFGGRGAFGGGPFPGGRGGPFSGGPGGPFPGGPGGPWGPRGGRGRARRGDIRAAVLTLLAEQPQHGYQLITELESRSGGRWKPSPGSVYPILQQLTDEGLLRPEEIDGRRIFHLTEAGVAAAAELPAQQPWSEADGPAGPDLRSSIAGLVGAVREVARQGDAQQAERARAILEEARRSLYRILADEPTASDQPTDAEPTVS